MGLRNSLLPTAAVVAGVGLAAWVAAGFHRVSPAGRVVVEGPGGPRALDPGLHWSPPLLSRVHRYPAAIDARWELEDPDLVTREGSRVRVRIDLEADLGREDAATFHQRLGPDWREVLGGEAEDLVREGLGELPDPLGADAVRLEDRVQGPLRGVLRLAGVEDAELDLTVTAWSGALSQAEAAGRVLLIGMDGLDWRIAEPLMAAGRMPHLRSLAERGARGRLRTLSPVLSPVLWTSMATGVEPHRHGILDFLAPGPDGEPIPITSNLRKVPALWNLLGEAGMTVGFVAWWGTWPAERVNGVMVSDRLAYTLFGLDRREGPPEVALTWPPSLEAELERFETRPAEVTVEELSRFIDLPGGRFPDDEEDLRRIDEARRSIAATRTYAAAAGHLLDTRELDLFAVYFEGPDVFSHLFMPFRPPRLASVSPERFDLFRRAVDEVYVWHDELLGELLDHVDLERTTVIVVSDHGFRSDEHRPAGDARIGHGQAADWHRKFGVLAMAGPPIRPGARVRETSLLDVPATVMALLGLPVAEDWPGRVLREAIEPGFLREHPVATVASYGERGAGEERRAVSSTADAAVLEKLIALGYVAGDEGGAGGSQPEGAQPEDSIQTLNNRGSALMAAGRLEEAEAAFREALEKRPDFYGARANLGIVLFRQGELEEAEAQLLQAHREDPDRAGIPNYLGELAGRRGDYEEAEAWFRKTLALDPGHAEAHNSLGVLMENRGRFEQAEHHYRRSVEIDPDFALGWNNLGNLAKVRGRRREAAELYRRAIEADPAYIGTYNNLGLLLQEDGRYDEAEELYREALARNPGHPEVRNNLASLYQETGRYDEAVAEYRRLTEEVPDYAEAWNNLGVAYGEMGDRVAQERAYREAVAIRPDYADAHHNLGLLLLQQGEGGEAASQFRRVLEIDPGYTGARRTLAATLIQGDREEEALEVIARGLEITPDDPGLYAMRGFALGQMARGEEGCQALRRSLELAPDQPNVEQAARNLGCLGSGRFDPR